MKHKSIPLSSPIELVDIAPTEYSPLVSKCNIKVCYVSDEPNRNRSVITKEVAKDMAPSLRGACIVGHYAAADEDYEEHNKIIEMKGGSYFIAPDTVPYGFVDINANVWFQKFIDDDKEEREYLVTEGYLWTGQFPEAQRIIDKGNNQSMELDNNLTSGSWTTLDNSGKEFFIINEAVISKLCILGENYEPCFEGATITNATNTQFSYEEDVDFKNKMLNFMSDIKKILGEGGKKPMFNTYAVSIGDSLFCSIFNHLRTAYPGEDAWCSKYQIEGVYEDGEQKFCIVFDPASPNMYHRIDIKITEEATTFGEMSDVLKEFVPASNPQFSLEAIEEFVVQKKKEAEEEEKKEDEKSDDKKPEGENEGEGEEKKDEEDDKKKKKKDYVLEEIPEYAAAMSKIADLEKQLADKDAEFSAYKEAHANDEQELTTLREFKVKADRAEKEAMINSFYMLSDEDKKPIADKIDEYSVEDIESKLAIMCVRNKVSFAKEDEKGKDGVNTYTLDDVPDNIPSWIKAVMETAEEM